MIEEIRRIAATWLEKKEIDYFIGYIRREEGAIAPVSIYHADDAGKLDFDEGCYHNLMSYVNIFKNDRIGILLKGCAGRSLVQLMAEGMVSRDHIKILGVACPRYKRQDVIEAQKCKSCYGNVPPIYDELVVTGQPVINQEEFSVEEVAAIEVLSSEQRTQYFAEEFSKCIRCYACREICPLCYCEECIAEKSDPQWVEISVKPSSNYYWNVIRAFHMTGRCVGCGECSRVCPVGIPHYLLHQKMAIEVRGAWGHVAGTDSGNKLPDLIFKNENRQKINLDKEEQV